MSDDINAVIARVLEWEMLCPACEHETCADTRDAQRIATALQDALKREEEAKEDIADLLTEARWADWADYPKGTYRKADEMRDIYERWFAPTPTANSEEA